MNASDFGFVVFIALFLSALGIGGLIQELAHRWHDRRWIRRLRRRHVHRI